MSHSSHSVPRPFTHVSLATTIASFIQCLPISVNAFTGAWWMFPMLLVACVLTTSGQEHDEGEGSMRGREEYFHDMRAWPFGRIPGDLRLQALDWVAKRGKLRSGALQSQAVWRPIGPYDLSGRITAIAVHPTDGKTLWAGAAAGGVWKSTNRGDSWRPVMDYENAITVGAIAVDPNNPDVVYVGTGEPAFNLDTYDGAGMFKSTDGGESWKVTGLTGVFAFSRIVVHPRDGNIIFASTIHNNAGFYRSTDAGRTWERILTEDITDITINPVNPSELWVGGGGAGVMRSQDGGRSFVPTANGLVTGDSGIGRVSLQVAPSNPSILYALMCVHTYSLDGAEHITKICRTSNGGLTWQTLFLNSPNFLNNPGFPQGEYNNTLAIRPDDENVVVAGGVWPYRTTDGGASWTLIGSGVHPDYHAFVFDPTDPNRLYAGNDGGVYRSDQGGSSFLRKTSGLAITQYYGMAIDQSVDDVTYGGTQDNGTVTTEAKTYDYSDPGFIYQSDGFQCIVDPLDPTVLYHEIFYGNILRTIIPSRQTSDLNGGLDLSEQASWSAPLLIDPGDQRTLFTGRKRVYRMKPGDYWRAISDTVAGTMTAIGVSPLDSRVIYAGSSRATVRATTDGGDTWREAASGLPGRSVTDIVASTRDTLTAWIAFSGFYNQHIYRTTDGGLTWVSLGTTFPDIPVNTLVVDPLNERKIYAGTDIGVLASSDGGSTWYDFGNGLPRVVVSDMEIHRSRRLLRVATHGRSMWEIDLGDTVVTPIITTPTGGEQWHGGTRQRISWNGVDGDAVLEYSLDDGSTWSMIDGRVSGGYYDWSVPDTTVIAARIRLRVLSDSTIAPTSRSFTVMSRRPGQVVAYDSKQTQLWGLTHDGTYLWASSVYGARFLLKIDPATLATLEKIPLTFDTAYRNFNGLAWDPVRGTFFLCDVTHTDPDGNGQAWILELDRDGTLLRALPSPAGYPTGIVWLPDSNRASGILVVSDLAGEQKFFVMDPLDGSTIRSYAPSRVLFLGPAGLAPGPEPGTFWQIMDDFSFDYGPRGSAALLMRLDDPQVICSADLHYTFDSTLFFPPYSWGKVSIAGAAYNPADPYLYLVNFDGTVMRSIACEPAPPASVSTGVGSADAATVRANPNPFSSVVELTVELAQQREGIIAVYDVDGREVRAVASGNIAAGVTTYHIDAGDLPSGMYRCVVMFADGERRSVPIVCVR